MTIRIGSAGEVTLPPEVRARYGMEPDAPIRIVGTRSGILLIRESAEPLSEELEQELAEWQAIGTEGLADFPWEDV